jgi:DNA-binding MarR family transcriptional regulator
MSEARSSAGQGVADLAVRILRLEGILTAAGDALAAPSGQSSARWRVLAAVEEQPLTVAQIARAWSLARQSVQRVADLLARDGLVAYEDNPGHRRAKLVRLTRRGRATLREIQEAQRRWADDLGARLVERDLQTANRILSDILDTLAEDPPSKETVRA